MRARARMFACVRACARARACTRTSVLVCVRACARVRACVCACVRVCARVRVYGGNVVWYCPPRDRCRYAVCRHVIRARLPRFRAGTRILLVTIDRERVGRGGVGGESLGEGGAASRTRERDREDRCSHPSPEPLPRVHPHSRIKCRLCMCRESEPARKPTGRSSSAPSPALVNWPDSCIGR